MIIHLPLHVLAAEAVEASLPAEQLLSHIISPI
jgi:hypothetical protein